MLWFLNAAQLKILNELRDDLVLETLQSLGILVEWEGMPVKLMFADNYQKGYVLLQKHIMAVYKKRFKFLPKEARKMRIQLDAPPAAETTAEPPQPAPVIDVMQIETAPPEKQIESVISQLAAYHKEYPELTERLLKSQEDALTDTSEES